MKNWQNEILKNHKGQTGFFKEIENKTIKTNIMKNQELVKLIDAQVKNAQDLRSKGINPSISLHGLDAKQLKELGFDVSLETRNDGSFYGVSRVKYTYTELGSYTGDPMEFEDEITLFSVLNK